MKRLGMYAVVVMAGVAGCHGASPGKAAVNDPAFDRAWSTLAKGGSDPAVIESDVHGAGLMGELRRAADPAPGPMLAGSDPLKGELPDDAVVRVIRSNLGVVKGCYQAAEHDSAIGSGKAIVSFEIAETGAVTAVQVDAPAFRESSLPACMSARAKAWSFPKFTQGPKRYAYPFVFVGG